ncbi:MAG: glycosyltransferase [Planctomycetota bacterium]
MTPKTHERVGVVVIGRNEGPRLSRCLASVMRDDTTVVYVDSASSDGSVERAKELGVHVIELSGGKMTAARGRQTGLDWLGATHPSIELVHFIDGDCVMDAEWLDAARTKLRSDETFVGVTGRRHEEDMAGSVWNRLIDMDWNLEPGEVPYFGGDALARIEAIQAVGGWNPGLIAGEEPELCFRMRKKGGRVWRLDQLMCEHDIAMTRFGEYWKRSRRSGHAYAEVGWMHRDGDGWPWLTRAVALVLQGLLLPALIVAALASTIVWWPMVFVAGVLTLPFAWWTFRMVRWCTKRGYPFGDSLRYAAANVACRPAAGWGVLQYVWGCVTGRRTTLIEYKANTPATSGTASGSVA